MRRGLKNMKNKYFREIVSFINFLDSLKDEDKIKIEKGELVIEHVLTQKILVNNINKSNKIENFNEIEIIKKLESMDSKQDGEKYLESLDLKKIQLEKILKELDSPFEKKDNMAKMISKIIEATIGFRLRSQAIQGTTSSD